MKTTANVSMSKTMKAIMSKAWFIVRTYHMTISEALKKAWALAKVKVAMGKRVVCFRYEKVSGEIRQAWGTLASEFLPARESAEVGYTHPTCQKYWDVEKNAWRQFKIVNLISMS